MTFLILVQGLGSNLACPPKQCMIHCRIGVIEVARDLVKPSRLQWTLGTGALAIPKRSTK